jgi:hypothetical protein
MRTRLQLYTVPGQVFYNTTRKLVLKGADGVVFVADSQRRMIEANVESFKNLEENLAEHDMKLAQMPLIVQFNKRDLPDVANIEELNAAINRFNAPIYEAVATTGIGVHETLKAITRLVLNALKERYVEKGAQRPATAAAMAGATPTAPAPAITPPASAVPVAAPARPAPPPVMQAATPAAPTIGRVEAFAEETADLVELDRVETLEESARQPAAHPPAHAAAPADDVLELDLGEAIDDVPVAEQLLELELEPEMEVAAPASRQPERTAAASRAAMDEVLDLGAVDDVHVIDTGEDDAAPDPLADSFELDAEPEAPSMPSRAPAPDPLFSDMGEDEALAVPQAGPPSRAAAPPPAWSAPAAASDDSDAAFEIDGDSLESIPPAPPAPVAPPRHAPVASSPAPGVPHHPGGPLHSSGPHHPRGVCAGAQEIALPVRLEIAGQMIQLELKISLDLIGRPTIASVAQTGQESLG